MKIYLLIAGILLSLLNGMLLVPGDKRLHRSDRSDSPRAFTPYPDAGRGKTAHPV